MCVASNVLLCVYNIIINDLLLVISIINGVLIYYWQYY